MAILDSRGFRLGFATLAVFSTIASDFWRDLTTWYGYGAVVLIIAVSTILLLVHNRKKIRLTKLPYPLIAFLALALVSIAWSAYRPETVLAFVTQTLTSLAAVVIAALLSWAELLRVLGWVFRLILGLSFVFEFIVAAFIRHPIYPVWVVPDDPAHPAKLLYWSRNLLFEAGKIQGIVGNSSLLAQAALIGLIVFGIQLATRSVGRAGWVWFAVAVVAIGLTRSATIFLAIAALVVITLAVVLVRRARTPRTRAYTYGGIVAVVAVLVVGAVAGRGIILLLLGKSTELTGRTNIWEHVIHTWSQRPGFGWGWISYWVPWAYPFTDKKLLYVEAGGVQVLHAHDAWLDVLFQLGVVGLVVFAALIVSTVWRSWQLAVDRSFTGPTDRGTHSWLSLLPLLVLVAQLIQSIAESRILVEGGWLLLVLWAVKSKWDRSVTELSEGRPRRAG